MAPKRKSKMTWEKLANDPSISKSELPRIARAFGLKKPEDAPSLAKRSRVAGGYKAPAKKAAGKSAAQKEPAAISSTRQKAVKPKATSKAATPVRGSGPDVARRKRMSTGTEAGFEEGPGGRVKRVATGSPARGKGGSKLVRAKDKTKKVDLWTGSAARGQRTFAPKQGPTEYRKYVPRRKK
jgi:hypothetical protein